MNFFLRVPLMIICKKEEMQILNKWGTKQSHIFRCTDEIDFIYLNMQK